MQGDACAAFVERVDVVADVYDVLFDDLALNLDEIGRVLRSSRSQHERKSVAECDTRGGTFVILHGEL
jgi:hypothetical protein